MADYHIVMTLHGKGTRYLSLGDGRTMKMEPGDKVKVKCEGRTCPICCAKKYPKAVKFKDISTKEFVNADTVSLTRKPTLTLKEQVKPGVAEVVGE